MKTFATALSLVVFALSLAATPPAFAADQDDIKVVVSKFVDSFNAGDAAAAQAVSFDDLSIIDEIPPYEWHGPGAMLAWLASYDADAKKNGITDGKVAVQKMKHVFVDGDRAYVVATMSYTYKKNAKPVKQNGSFMTLALRKAEGSWKIAAWSWGQN